MQRRKRFFLDVALPPSIPGESLLTLHCPNTGSMRSCLREGARVLFSDSDKPGRKLRYTAELIHSGRGWIGIHTGRTNTIVREILRLGLLPGFEGYDRIQPEPFLREQRMRPDFLLSTTSPDADLQRCYMEVKNVTFYESGCLAFPDSRSERATRHVKELARLIGPGVRACVLFLASRPEGEGVRPADSADPIFGRALREAVKAGLEVRAVRVRYDRKTVRFAGELPVWL